MTQVLAFSLLKAATVDRDLSGVFPVGLTRGYETTSF